MAHHCADLGESEAAKACTFAAWAHKADDLYRPRTSEAKPVESGRSDDLI
jgi:hypothetical protein